MLGENMTLEALEALEGNLFYVYVYMMIKNRALKQPVELWNPVVR